MDVAENDCSSVFAVVVSYNGDLAAIGNLAAALAAQTRQVIVVDNGSVNAAQLQAQFATSTTVRVLALASNQGIAAAQNAGIALARQAGAGHVVFFDQDSVIGPGFVANLAHAFVSLSAMHRVAATVPVLKDWRYGFYYPLIALNRIGLRTRIVPNGTETAPFAISLAISSGTFTSMAVLDEVGAMRADFFIDYVDTEWCLRASARGYAIFAVPQACLLHAIGDAAIPLYKWRLVVHSATRRYYRIRNAFFLLRLAHVPKLLALREVLINTVHQCILLLSQGDRRRQFGSLLRGTWHGVGKF